MTDTGQFSIGARVTWYLYSSEGTILEHGGGLIVGRPKQYSQFGAGMLEVLVDGQTKVVLFAERDCMLEKDWSDNLSIR